MSMFHRLPLLLLASVSGIYPLGFFQGAFPPSISFIKVSDNLPCVVSY